MKTQGYRIPSNHGSALITTIILGAILAITAAAMMQLSCYRLQASHERSQWTEAFYHAENVLNWGAQKVADSDTGGPSAPFLGQYSVNGGTISLPYLTTLTGSGASLFQNAWLTISNHPSGINGLYYLTASAKVGKKTRTVRMTLQKNPPSQVFDYEYFLNNWGWWWGNSISGWGDNRANWDFDFKDSPTVNGSVMANGQIESNGKPVDPLSGTVPFVGLAGNDPTLYVHSGSPRLKMPNLLDFSYYKTKAQNDKGKLYVGTNLIVNAVHTNATKPGLYLIGTVSNPIIINGPVVIPGDVIIKGVISGIGTMYVGSNLYVAGDLTYLNGPDFSTPPATMSATNRDTWVANAVNAKKDLVAFAVRESILGGAVNSSEWKSRCYDPTGYGLKYVGNEANLGQDGIANTPDDGVAYLDTNGDGKPDSAWYDADGDGTKDSAYNYDTQLKVTSTRADKIFNYPTNSSGTVLSYDSVSTNNMNTAHGVFYCNHALAMRLGKNNASFQGAVICRDEAIIFTSTAKFRYDCRIHSRYSNDPNRYIDLGLPVANKVAVRFFEELPPREGFGI